MTSNNETLKYFGDYLEKGITVKIPLEIDSTTGGFEKINESEIKQAINYNLKSIILTEPGERINTNFGVGIKSILFENFNSSKVTGLKKKIKNQIKTFLPFLVFDVKVTQNTDNNLLAISIKYKIDSIGLLETYNLNLDLTQL